MADILIKGVEMPKSCIDPNTSHGCFNLLHCHVGRQRVSEGKSIYGKSPDCPLIEIPSHGLLIDADEYEQIIVQAIMDAERDSLYTEDEKRLVKEVYESALFRLRAMTPTVLEATNGTISD